jgi:ATP-dependent DNA helicase RecG
MLVIENGYQSAMMAPTEVLAKQHFNALEAVFESYGIRCGLLVGSMSKKQKLDVYKDIENGDIELIIGTHAVIQEGVAFNNLALVVTDEQHRFGVKQRELLAGKGHFPHVLVMSATPIPRTLALILYGDMDVSIIDEMPPGRQAIETYSVTSAYRERIRQFILKEIQMGRQIYIVCPMVEENESLELANVMSYTEELKEALPNDIRIQTLHGKMRPKDKNSIMASYVEGSLDILVSTTVIEVGINVPNASVMVIEDAHRFGLAQLHQLRGRVGRGSDKSYCVLMTDATSSQSKKRMTIMTDTTDGFLIAEKDLELRGHGDLLGLRQSGMPSFKLAHILEDAAVLKDAHNVAKTIKEKHDILHEDNYKELSKRINHYMETYMSYIAL